MPRNAKAQAPARLSAAALKDHLFLHPPAVQKTVRALRKAVLAAAPAAAEAIRFHVLCYFHAEAWFGSIGGNICMIEIKPARSKRDPAERVLVTFIHGAPLVDSGADPAGLLTGDGKSKRVLHIPDPAFAARKDVAALIRAAETLHPWD